MTIPLKKGQLERRGNSTYYVTEGYEFEVTSAVYDRIGKILGKRGNGKGPVMPCYGRG